MQRVYLDGIAHARKNCQIRCAIWGAASFRNRATSCEARSKPSSADTFPTNERPSCFAHSQKHVLRRRAGIVHLTTMTLHIGAGPGRPNISKFPASSKEFCSTVGVGCLEQHWKLPVPGNFSAANRSCVSPASSVQLLQHFTHENPSRCSAATGGITRQSGLSSTARTPTIRRGHARVGKHGPGLLWRVCASASCTRWHRRYSRRSFDIVGR
jgi:hypothetical protein